MLIYFFNYTYLCGGVKGTHHDTDVEVRDQLAEVGSLFLLCRSQGDQTQPSGLTEPFHLSNLTSLENHLMYNFLLYFYLIGNYMFQKAKKMLSGIFYPCLLAYWTPLPRSNQSTSVLGVCQSSPCLSMLAISLCPWTCAFVTQLCICTNYTQHSVFCTSQFLCCSPWCCICTL